MKRRDGVRPSHALVVSVLAVTIAIVASAIADTGVRTSDLGKPGVKKIAKAEAKKVLKRKESKLSVASAKVGGPAAYASIDADGSIDPAMPSRGMNSASVDNVELGAYCFDLGFSPTTAAVSPIQEGQLPDDAILSVSFDPADYVECPVSAEAEVTNLDADDGYERQNDDFNVQFDR